MTTWMLLLQLILPVADADASGAATTAAAADGLHADTLSTLRYRGIEALFSKFRSETPDA